MSATVHPSDALHSSLDDAAKIIGQQRQTISELREALKWFAEPSNWSQEQLSDGVYFSAEWKLGFSPITAARAALNRTGE